MCLLLAGAGHVFAQSVYLGPDGYLEIDRRPDTSCDDGEPDGTCSVTESANGCPSDCELAADANLVQGSDPADGTDSLARPPCPPGGNCEFIDWSDLTIAQHRVDDPVNLDTGKDDTSFPQANACVAPAANLPRQDLGYAGVANNLDHGYFALKREAANGDAAFFWLVNRIEPTWATGPVDYVDWSGSAQSCSATQTYLSYDITTGDLLLVGEFVPGSGETILRVFRAVVDVNDVDARSALDFLTLVAAGVLEELATDAALAAVNTTITSSGDWGGVAENYDPYIFTEAAVSMEYFAGEDVACGLTYHVSVISKPSTSAASDPKDLVTPFPITMDGCPATAPVCSEYQCSGCASDSDCSGDYPHLPACQPSGACGQCSASNQTLCTGESSSCNLLSGTCEAPLIFLDGFELSAGFSTFDSLLSSP